MSEGSEEDLSDEASGYVKKGLKAEMQNLGINDYNSF